MVARTAITSDGSTCWSTTPPSPSSATWTSPSTATTSSCRSTCGRRSSPSGSRAPHLRDDGGSVVNVSSVAALHPYPSLMAYGMSKIALERLTVDAAAQLAGSRIAVNCFRIDVPVASEGFVANTPGADHYNWEPAAVAAEGIVWMLRQPATYSGRRESMLRPPARARASWPPGWPTADHTEPPPPSSPTDWSPRRGDRPSRSPIPSLDETDSWPSLPGAQKRAWARGHEHPGAPAGPREPPVRPAWRYRGRGPF